MIRLVSRFALAVIAALALSTSRPASADGYKITDLGDLPGKPYASVWQQTISNGGVVAVYVNGDADTLANTIFFGDSTFLWHKGTILPLSGLPGAIDTVAFAVNERAQAVGRSTPDGERSHAVLWDHGVIYRFPELPGDDKSASLMINNSGQAVGYSRQAVANGNLQRAVVWDKGTVTRLGSLPSGEGFEESLGINSVGQIVGFAGPQPGLEHGVLWYKGAVTDLGTLGGPSSDAVAINEQGQIVGIADTAGGPANPFLWQNGVMIDLGTLPGDVGGLAEGINNKGQVAGISGTAIVNGEATNIYTSHAMLWENGTMVNLQTRIPANSGWTLTTAAGINDRGQIVCQGVYNGVLRAVLLTPVH
jgi:probable extracellular repeat, HAF family